MANGGSRQGGFGEVVGTSLQFAFSLTFPLLMISVCGVSFVLASAFHAPEFLFWALLGKAVFEYAKTNLWVALGLAVFSLSALPLAWIAYREQQLRVSTTILAWLVAIIAIGGMFWLRTVWPFDRSFSQPLVYAFILLFGWASAIEAGLGTLGIAAHIRSRRAVRVQTPKQQPHGAPDRSGSSDELDTI